MQLPVVQLEPKQLCDEQPKELASHPLFVQEPKPEVPQLDVQVTVARIGSSRPDFAS